MEIEELILKSYGKFTNHHIRFRPGINVLYGGNEAGKTTVHSFIRAMLFGLNRGRGRAAKKDEYQIRQPWDSPGAFLGSMRIREDGMTYRIDRCFDRSAAPLDLVCETKSVQSDDPQRDLEVLLGGISEAAFVNSVFIPQAQCETDEALAQELRRYMINSDSSLDGGVDVTGALQILRRKKKQYEQKKKKEDAVLEEKIGQKQAREEQLRRDLELLREQARQYEDRRGRARREKETGFTEEEERKDAPDRLITLLRILLLAAGVLTAAGAFLLDGTVLRIFLGVFAVLFLGMSAAVFLLFRPARGAADDFDEEEEEDLRCPKSLLEEIYLREEEQQKLQAELEELYQKHAAPEDTEIAALTLAIDRICELSDGIYRTHGGRLNETTSAILSEITGGRYNRIVLDDTAEVRLYTPSRVLGLHQVSGGTLQQIYFALRMAAGELFCGETSLPVILDETFAMYDDRRLEAALRWLKQSRRQVLLFTCQSREREILKRI